MRKPGRGLSVEGKADIFKEGVYWRLILDIQKLRKFLNRSQEQGSDRCSWRVFDPNGCNALLWSGAEH